MSDEDRLVEDADIVEYDNRSNVISNRNRYNFYITTDFATSERDSSDYSVISVWAYTNNGDWLWVDGICKRQLMDKNIDDLFRLISTYKPMSVGIEVTGQQGGFIQWIQQEMLSRNIFFNMASENNSNKPGIRPNTNKMQRFNTVLPLFKQRKIWFPKELKDTPELQEMYDELRNASKTGFKSKHDDMVDTISMLSVMSPFKPSQEAPIVYDKNNDKWEIPDEEDEIFIGNSTIF